MIGGKVKQAVLFIGITLIFILINGSVYAAQTMTLEQCLKTGIKNNPSLEAARFGVNAADYDIKAARADFLPSLSSGYSMTSIHSKNSEGPTDKDYLDQDIRSFNIKLIQILYAGSRIVNTYEKSKLQKQVAIAQMDLEKLELIYNIEATFYKLMKARQDEIIITESVGRLTEGLKATEAFFKKELIPYVDVLETRVDLADAKTQLGIAKNNQNRERMVLFSLMNLGFDSGIEFVSKHYNTLKDKPSFESNLKYAFENRPDIKSLEEQLKIAEKEAIISMNKYLPVVKFDVGYYDEDRDYDKEGTLLSGSFDRDQTNRYWSTGISATWNIFDGGRSWYGKEKYKTEARKIKALIKETQNMIATGIRKALYSMSEAQQRIINSADALIAAREYYTREKRRLRAGISTVSTVLDAHVRLIRAQGNQTRANLDYQLAKSEFKLMRGGMLNREDSFSGE